MDYASCPIIDGNAFEPRLGQEIAAKYLTSRLNGWNPKIRRNADMTNCTAVR